MKEVAVGIDIGGTFTKYGIVDKGGKCLTSDSISTKSHPEINNFLDTLKSAIDITLEKIKGPLKLRGIGIGAPNGNFYKGTIEFAPNLSWTGIVPIVELFRNVTTYLSH